ncbi:hypothetical protein EGT07_23730 [Herbaspirillum sp. HC18]|nr:hypothetical protein EGT07_23730 [Herbaspirillum sp. HC18]
MNLLSKFRKTAVFAGLSLASMGAIVPQSAHASGIPVVDVAAIAQLIVDQISQNLQYGEQAAQTLQMYTDYALQLQNLAALPGAVRDQVENNLKTQIANNIADFGVSYLNGATTLDPNSPAYYANLEGMYKLGMNEVPRTTTSLDVDLAAVGLGTGTATAMGQSAYTDRVQWERVMDDMRQVALTRKNAEQRSVQAKNIAVEMKNLPANNTVGAMQLLAGQQTLNYAQNEDLLKNQAALLKNDQEQQARFLAEREELRKRELTRLNKVKAETFSGAVTTVSY